MQYINTSVPIPMSDLRTLVTTPESVALLNYSESKLKDRALLIYCANANVPIEFDMTGVELDQIMKLIDAYVTLKSTLNVPSLVNTVGVLLLAAVGADAPTITPSLLSSNDIQQYLDDEQRRNNLSKLALVINNLTTYIAASHVVHGPRVRQQSVEVNDIDFTGTTFIHLVGLEWFLELFFSVPSINTTPIYFPQQYDEYIFSGQNLFRYIQGSFLMLTSHLLQTNPAVGQILSDVTPADVMEAQYDLIV